MVQSKPPTSRKPAKRAAGRAAGGKKTKGGKFSPPSPARVAEIFARFAAADPAPKGELEHTNPFTLLVAVVLSAQATDAGVNKATRALFLKADTPKKMVALGEETVREHIKSIGLYRNKARNVVLLSQMLIDLYGGEVPKDRDALETLPGVGRKTANVVMNVAFGAATMAVDTHVFRVSHRLGLSNGKNPLEVEADLLAIVPEKYGVHAHHWLILHGRYVCLARKPKCPTCLIEDLCPFEGKTLA
jgi:endonuclease-3